jgi:hypothetical protein
MSPTGRTIKYRPGNWYAVTLKLIPDTARRELRRKKKARQRHIKYDIIPD